MHEGNINQIVYDDNRCRNGNNKAEIEGKGHERFFSPHKPGSNQGFPEPGPLPAHLLPEEYMIGFRHNGRNHRRILIGGPMMAKDEIRKTSVIAKGGFVS